MILVYKAGYEIDFRKIEVLEDEITQANFFLTPNQNPTGAKIYGYVTDEAEGEPLARVKMVLYLLPSDFVSIPEFDIRDSGFSPLMSTYSNKEGYYEFEGLDEGLYFVLALKEGMESWICFGYIGC